MGNLLGLKVENLAELEESPFPVREDYSDDETFIDHVIMYEVERAHSEGYVFDYDVGTPQEQLERALNAHYKLSQKAIDAGLSAEGEDEEYRSRSKSPSRKSPKKQKSPKPKPEKGPRKNARQPSPERLDARRGVFRAPVYRDRKTVKPPKCQDVYCDEDNMYVGIKKGNCECMYYRREDAVCQSIECPKNQAIILSDEHAAKLDLPGKRKCDCYIPSDIRKKRSEAKAKERAAKNDKLKDLKRRREEDLAKLSSAERKKLEQEAKEEDDYLKEEKRQRRIEKQRQKQENKFLDEQVQAEAEGFNLDQFIGPQGGSVKRSRSRRRSRKRSRR